MTSPLLSTPRSRRVCRRASLFAFSVGVALASGFVAPAAALQTPTAGPRDNRVRTIVYDAANVVNVDFQRELTRVGA